MADVTLKHPYTSYKADGSDPTQVRASNWNESHVYTGGADGQVLVRDSVSNTGASWIPKTTAGVDVSSYATGGSGTSGSPWIGWDTAITWTAETEYHFKSGWFSHSTSPNFLKTGIALIGEAGTFLKHTGSGNAVSFDDNASWTFNVRMENFIIVGNSNTTNGLFLRGVRNSIFKHISVRDVSNAGLWNEACVTNILENFRVSHHEMAGDVFVVRPKYGMVNETRSFDGAYSTTWTVTNIVIEGVSLIGIYLLGSSYNNTFINGTAEGNLAKGAVIGIAGRPSGNNTFINMDFEANTGGIDCEVYGDRNVFIGIFTTDLLHIQAGSGNSLIGGSVGVLTIDSHLNLMIGATCRGVYTDNDSEGSTVFTGNVITTNGGVRYDSYLNNTRSYPKGLTISSGLVATDCRRAKVFTVSATGDFTLSNPTNPFDGETITWRIEQDATGSRVISYDTKFVAINGGALPVLTTTPLSRNYISAIYDLTRNTWDVSPIKVFP